MTRTQQSDLPLPTLEIFRFRGIRRLETPELTPVTLLTGPPAVGKTTLLEAVELWAHRGSPATLARLLKSRDEFRPGTLRQDRQGKPELVPDTSALLHLEEDPISQEISIGPQEHSDKLTIRYDPEDQEEPWNLVVQF